MFVPAKGVAMTLGVLRQTAVLLVSVLISSSVLAAVPDKYSDAVAALKAGDAQTALQQLSELVDAGSKDPRVYYFRGIAAAGLNKSPDADFKRVLHSKQPAAPAAP